MKPEDTLKLLDSYSKKIAQSKKMHVAVGLPKEKTSSVIYGDGQSVIDIGAHHEYGTSDIPQRSFLRLPFNVKKKELDAITKKLYKKVFEDGMSVDTALGRLGLHARNISVDAFRSNGYGKWEPVKHSGTALVDTGTLRNSITHIVRKGK